MKTMKCGLFVTFDGANGSGKSTIIPKVNEKLISLGLEVVQTKEPTESSIGKLIRTGEENFKGNSYACLIAADRYFHINSIVKPNLELNKVVLSDRYFPSSLILQSLDGVSEDFIWKINEKILKPNLCVFLNVEPSTLSKRIMERNTITRLERDFTRDEEVNVVRRVYKTLKEKGFNVMEVNNEDGMLEQNVDIICEKIYEMYQSITPQSKMRR